MRVRACACARYYNSRFSIAAGRPGVVGFQRPYIFLDFCVSRISSSIISFIVNSGHGSCAARLGAHVRGAQGIANFGLDSCAVRTDFGPRPPGPRPPGHPATRPSGHPAPRPPGPPAPGPPAPGPPATQPPGHLALRPPAHFCAGCTGSGTLSDHTESGLKSCENYLFTNGPICSIIIYSECE